MAHWKTDTDLKNRADFGWVCAEVSAVSAEFSAAFRTFTDT
jgi:hypothetical protein